MTEQQAWGVIAVLREGAAAQELDDGRLKLWHKHVVPLPYGRTLAVARRWIVAPSDDGRPKFLSSLDDVLTALHVPASARPVLSEAAFEGGEVHPSLERWVRVLPGEPLPPSVLALAAMNAAAARPALPAAPPISEEKRVGLVARIRALGAAWRTE